MLRAYDKAILDFTQAIKLNAKSAYAYSSRASAYDDKGEIDKAIADYSQAIKLRPTSTSAYNRAFLYEQKGEYGKAITDYNYSIKLNPKQADGYNSLAWLLATCPIEKYRDGKKAVKHALRACEFTKWKDSNFIDTLSVAYAEAGNFSEAIKWQQKALEDETYKKENGDDAREKLKLFSEGKPYRTK